MGSDEAMTHFCPCGAIMVLIGNFYHCPKHGRDGKKYKEPRRTSGKYSGFSSNVKGGYEDKLEGNSLTKPKFHL